MKETAPIRASVGDRIAVQVPAQPRGQRHDPLAQLGVGVGEITELAQDQEGALDVFDARLHAPLQLGFARRTGIDLEAVALGVFAVGALHLGIMGARAGDGALGVVDDQPGGNTGEPLEGAAVAGQPSLYALVPDHLGILVAAEAQSHDEDPALVPLPGSRVHQAWTRPKVHLGRLAGGELQTHCRQRHRQRQLLHKHSPPPRGGASMSGEASLHAKFTERHYTTLQNVTKKILKPH
jgi:hypothetical protein